MAARYGQGSVWRDQAKDLWVGQVDLGTDSTGRRIRRRVKGKTKQVVMSKMREAQTASDNGLPVANKVTTTGAWLNLWATEILPRSVKASTVTNYSVILSAYVIPHVGKIPLAKLAPSDVERMMKSLESRGLSPRTVGYARAVLRRSLSIAVKQGRVVRNVAGLTDAPRKRDSKLDDTLDASEAAAVLQAASGDRLEALAVLVLAVGLRQGEAFNLRWDDIDFDAGTATITKAKTDAGIRTVALPHFVVSALKAHRTRQVAERLAAIYWADPDLVFPSTVGTRLDRRNVLRWWHDLTISAGVGRRRFHASRHTAATLMLNNGVSLEVVSKTLGHAGLSITADVYARVGPKLQRQAADRMQEILGPRE